MFETYTNLKHSTVYIDKVFIGGTISVICRRSSQLLLEDVIFFDDNLAEDCEYALFVDVSGDEYDIFGKL